VGEHGEHETQDHGAVRVAGTRAARGEIR
jgi:hypothetical protein